MTVATGYEEAELVRSFSASLKRELPGITESGVLPESIVRDMKASGLFRLLQPRVFGGAEQDLERFFDWQVDLSKSCMSAGWLMGVFSLHAWQLSLFDPQAQNDVWEEDPSALICSSFMPVGHVQQHSDGYYLSGQWKYASGCTYSSWALLGGLVHTGEGQRDYRAFLVPASDFEVSEDWKSVGLRATESHSVIVDRAYVPAYRTFRAQDGLSCNCPGHELHANPIYKIPFGQLFALSTVLPSVGALAGAVESVLGTAGENPRLASSSVASELKMALADALAVGRESLDVAKANLHRLFSAAQAGRTPSIEERASIRFQSAKISKNCAESISKLFSANGGRSISMLDRCTQAWLDINVANLHAANNTYRFGNVVGDVYQGRESAEPLL